jgi:hypothetical protein
MMMFEPDFVYDRPALERFLTVLYRLREETQTVVESGPVVIELIGGYILFIDPADSSSGFVASVQFKPPTTDSHDVVIAEVRFEGSKADLFAFVINALCDDVPNLNERLPALAEGSLPRLAP